MATTNTRQVSAVRRLHQQRISRATRGIAVAAGRRDGDLRRRGRAHYAARGGRHLERHDRLGRRPGSRRVGRRRHRILDTDALPVLAVPVVRPVRRVIGRILMTSHAETFEAIGLANTVVVDVESALEPAPRSRAPRWTRSTVRAAASATTPPRRRQPGRGRGRARRPASPGRGRRVAPRGRRDGRPRRPDGRSCAPRPRLRPRLPARRHRLARRVQVRPAAGWRRVRLDRRAGDDSRPARRRARSRRVGKAFAADRLAARVHSATGTRRARQPGRRRRGRGRAARRLAVLVTDDHRGLDGTGQTVGVAEGGLATSSTTVRRWLRAAGRSHHVVDPATGVPAVEHWRTVSVAAATCVDANVGERPPRSSPAPAPPRGSTARAAGAARPARRRRRHDIGLARDRAVTADWYLMRATGSSPCSCSRWWSRSVSPPRRGSVRAGRRCTSRLPCTATHRSWWWSSWRSTSSRLSSTRSRRCSRPPCSSRSRRTGAGLGGARHGRARPRRRRSS